MPNPRLDRLAFPPGSFRSCPVALLCIVAALLAAPVAAQPSGGPYGPVPQTYEVPAQGTVYYVAPDGDADAAGTALARPTTIESAIARVVTGDAIVMRGGLYRAGGLQLNQGITIQPYRDEQPVLKGTRVAREWEALRDGVWRTKWETLFPARPLGWWRREREGMRTPLHRFNNDMVFVDGEPLQSAGWEGELDETSYYIDYDGGYVYLGVDPEARLVEITAHDVALHRPSRPVHGRDSDGKGPTIRGITFTQYAFRAIDIEGEKPSTGPNQEPTDDPVGVSDPADHGKAVTGTTLEHVTISHTSRVAGYFRGDGLTIRNSLVSDTGTEGIYVIGSSDVLLERNIIRRNNVERLTGYFPAAVKIFNQSYRVAVRDNLVIEHPDSNGVWYDVGNVDGVFANNHVEGTLIGFFFEISKGVVAAGNVFVDNEQGIRVLNSADARVYHNTFLDSPVMFDRNERSAKDDHFGWHPQTGPDVDEREGHVFEGNLLVASRGFDAPLLHFDQPAALCGTLPRPMAARVDGNAYVRATAADAPLVTWSPVRGRDCLAEFASLEDFRGATGAETRGRAWIPYEGAVFRSVELRRFELARPLPGMRAVPVAEEAGRVLGWSATSALPGAVQAGSGSPLP
ncbi:right-handed parallel beta-helix repeat-containing protein [Luteimonas sp. RD2P54]|uniref:Right-handed parallel beta-helix repeat-containing protein n=1 Tax=Luteimonas endophytica TaxID=3042023 RepID=A0ABT6JBS1_9GAMM|nr:right-handed parallel beta-helix repeat-containing protein [Luteimonas endophytica]MDH5823628.1 right-handed parallel beta-helix repeat-containing protein [Luteimonas endophytica]